MSETKKPKAVALVGMARSHRHLAPYSDTDVEIWTINESHADRKDFKDKEGNHFIQRCTRHFQLHPYWNAMRPQNNNDPAHPDWLKEEHPFPIYMQEAFEDVPSAVAYPFDEVFSGYPDFARYATSSFPYLMALAIHEGFEQIHIYGFDMGSETEYAYQKAATEFWIGIALGKGIDLVFPETCKLLNVSGLNKLYAFEMVVDVNPMRLEMEHDRFLGMEERGISRINVMTGEQAYLARQLQDGGLKPKKKEKISRALYAKENEMIDLHARINFYSGARQAIAKIRKDLMGQLSKDIEFPSYKIRPDNADVELTAKKAKDVQEEPKRTAKEMTANRKTGKKRRRRR